MATTIGFEKNPKVLKQFRELALMECFLFTNIHFMKVRQSDDVCNAINIKEGVPRRFSDGVEVLPVDAHIQVKS